MVQNDELRLDAELVRRQLNRIVSSDVFSAAKRSRMFLRYIVERSLLGSPPKEFEIAAEVLGRGANYDPDIDAAVRVEASRLRYRLREYYDTAGKNDPVFIDIPKGGYRAHCVSAGAVPVVSASVAEDSAAAASDALFTNPLALDSAALGSTSAEAQSHTGQSRRGTRWLSFCREPKWCIGAVLAAAAFAGFLLPITPWASGRRPQPAGPIHSLAVLPLENLSGNVREEYFVDGMTDALITELAHTSNLRVVSRTSVMREKGKKHSLRQIASALGVDAVIEGSVVRGRDQVRITAQLIDARDDRHIWAQSYEEQISDILTLQDKVVRDIVLQTEAALRPRRESVRSPRIDPAAYDAYLRGLYFLNQRDIEKSANYLQQAVSLDPLFAAAYAGLAEALTARSVGGNARPEDLSRALAAAKRAIELDGESGEAYAALGFAETQYGNWTAAGRDLEKGIALNPNDSLAEMQYSIYLDAMARPEEAVNHMRRALQLDPRSFLMNRHLGSTLYFARRYEEAIRYLQRAEEMEPARFDYVEEWLARCYEMALRFDDATRADLRHLSAAIPDAELAPLRQAYRQGGWSAYQRARIELLGKQPREGCDLYDVGESYVRLHDANLAFSWLGRGVEAQCFWADLLPVDPVLDGIRSDPRFSALLQMGRLGKGQKAAGN